MTRTGVSAVPGYLTRDRLAVLAGLAAPLVLAAVLVPFRASFPDTDAALAMLLVVVAVAANGDRLAGVLAAVSTAVWFDFFLTQPYERFTITRRTDIETTVLLVVIGVAVTEIAVWGRRHYVIASLAGRLPRRHQQRSAGGRGRRLRTRPDRPGRQPAYAAAFAADLRLPVRRRRAGPGPPGCIATVRSPSGNGAGRGTARASRRAPRWSCWWKAAASSRAGS